MAIKVFIPSSKEFINYERKIKKYYEHYKKMITDTNSFDFIKKNTLFYLFVDNNEIIGAIYFFLYKKKLYLNAFAPRGHLKQKLEALKLSLSWFKTDIYAEAQNRASAFCLLRCGFKRIRGNLFVYTKLNRTNVRERKFYDI